MDEGTIRQAAKMWALVAEMEVIKANIEAMKADNMERQEGGYQLAWAGDMFEAAAKELLNISLKLANEI